MVVFLTGASGVIGREILARLVLRPEVERVYALVHETSVAATSTKATIVEGSITAGEALGMTGASLAQLGNVTAVIHAAADTRFDGPSTALNETNVVGTYNVLQFARRLRRLDRVCVLSTVYVAGRRCGRISESELAHDAGFVNDYERSKYDMEVVLQKQRRALPIARARLSTVIGDSRDGHVGSQTAFHHALRLYYQSLAPMLPGTEDSPVDLIPTDYAADAVATLVCDGFTPGATWHVCAGDDAPEIGCLLDLAMNAFHACRPAWRRRAIARPAVVPLATFERFADTVEELEDATLSAAIRLVRPFAPQLAYPKRFDDTAARTTLNAHGVIRPRLQSYFRQVVQHLIEVHWSIRADAATA
jgi:nucleoside-diphosphate-sugar epimerase